MLFVKVYVELLRQGVTKRSRILQSTLKWGLLAGVLCYVYFPTFVWMINRWTATDSYYGHGFLIPVITGYWLLRGRRYFADLEPRSDRAGFILLICAALLQVAGSLLRVYFLSAVSFVGLLLGLTDYLFGRQVFRQAAFPLLFLLLMIPLPLLAIAQLTLKMKFFVSQISVHLINATGIEAVREGSYILLPHATLLVGDPCSGLRSFLAFLCLGVACAYSRRLRLWQKAVLVVAGWPLAISSNVVRVWFLGLVAEIYGAQHAGPGNLPHDVAGMAVFLMAFAVFLWVRSSLESWNVRLAE